MTVQSALSALLDRLGIGAESPLRKKSNDFISWRRTQRNLAAIKATESYGQFGEDAVLQSLLPERIGSYVDIGSGHPIVGSNTFALYRKGWSGILIDPVKSNIELSRNVRPRDESIHAAIGVSNSHPTDSIDFIEFETYQYSTTNESRAQHVLSLGHPIKSRYSVELHPLSKILSSRKLNEPVVLSIDVEGEEMSVLRSNDWHEFSPDFILIEDLEPPLGQSTEVSRFLEAKGYELHAICAVTCVYRLRSDMNVTP